MTQRIDARSLKLQQRLRRDELLNDLAHWFVDILPPGVLTVPEPEPLLADMSGIADGMEKIGITDLELLALVLTVNVCIGANYEDYYPAASRVLRTSQLTQAEKAAWFTDFLNSFPYLRGERFAKPIRRRTATSSPSRTQSAPPGLLTPEGRQP